MTIETKFNIGDEVWSTYSGKAFKGKVFTINEEGVLFIEYDKFGPDQVVPVIPAFVYSTKEELIESLFN